MYNEISFYISFHFTIKNVEHLKKKKHKEQNGPFYTKKSWLSRLKNERVSSFQSVLHGYLVRCCCCCCWDGKPPTPFQGLCEAETIFIKIVRCYLPFPPCWHYTDGGKATLGKTAGASAESRQWYQFSGSPCSSPIKKNKICSLKNILDDAA